MPKGERHADSCYLGMRALPLESTFGGVKSRPVVASDGSGRSYDAPDLAEGQEHRLGEISMMNVPDWISAFANVGVAGAAIAAAFHAIRGIAAWKKETLGRRRMELAEEVLAEFYEAKDVLTWVRSPWSFPSEAADRAGRDQEPEEERKLRDTYFAPISRIERKAEFFARLYARRYRVIATFGQESGQAYTDLHRVKAEIEAASVALMRAVGPARRGAEGRFADLRERQEGIIWAGAADPDLIAARIEALVVTAENRFRVYAQLAEPG